jgi:hypothetical protein
LQVVIGLGEAPVVRSLGNQRPTTDVIELTANGIETGRGVEGYDGAMGAEFSVVVEGAGLAR